MELNYIAHSCFKIKGKDITLVIDPYSPDKTGIKFPKLSADVLLISHGHEDHNYSEGVNDYRLIIDGPGEYEIQDSFIFGIHTFHDENSGADRGSNTMYLIEIDDLSILHAGDLGHELSKETIEKIPNVDILLIPVGGTYTIDAKTAVKVISSLEPSIVVPMHYQTKSLTGLSQKLDTLDKFLDEIGVEDDIKKVEKLKISRRTEIPEEMEVVIIKPQY